MANTFFYQWLRAGMSIAAVLLTFTGCVMAGKPTAEYFEGQHRTAARAIDENNMDDLRRIGEQLDDINSLGRNGITLLWYAIVKKNYPAISVLIELGADPEVGTAAKEDKVTPIDAAVMYEQSDTLTAMLDGGLSPDYGLGPNKLPLLAFAVSYGSQHVSLLLEHGANVNQTSLTGGTALHSAVVNKPDLAADLIRRGADVNASTTNGVTATWSVWRKLEHEAPGSKWRSKWEQVRNLMIERGSEWPPEPPEKVRERRREEGLEVAEPGAAMRKIQEQARKEREQWRRAE